ncbi:nuclear transport factor 2 family protein [Pseudomarimonas arenosa]|uniref:Nuclear transport factor 2 family protein n=1 Tax=Pseudomarimonas arenosa TaxID=2774145 RepID=A0AAW3ZJ32_9GAMM|nr:nuclear transport factor 2 family protein [Pseudomarimonas arenosa]MBD8525162.1 nuclear transport factor 2 family protein [Pseudomarimonas arenosa]
MRVRQLFPATLGLLVLAGSAIAAPQDAEQRMRAFFAATERQDVEQMVAAVSEDFRWISIEDERMNVEVVGRDQLRSWLDGYFRSTPGLHTQLIDLQVDGSYVSLIEQVVWTGKEGRQERQTATSVYQLDDAGQIRRAWYFPAQDTAGESAPAVGSTAP